MKRKIVGMVLIAWLALIAQCWAADANFPTKPIHAWIGWQPGSFTETLLRAAGPDIEKVLGQPLVIENKPGGTGSLAFGLLKTVKPDGYTLATASDSAFTRLPYHVGVKYDPFNDFTFIIIQSWSSSAAVVKSDSPFKTFRDLIEYSRKNPGNLTHGTPGVASNTHLALEKISQIEKIKMEYVFFQGAAQVVTAVLGGHVMFGSCYVQASIPHVKAGTLRFLCSYDNAGLEEWPEVPTLGKLGYNFDAPVFDVIAAPKGVPKPIVDKLVLALTEGLKSQQIKNLGRAHGCIIPDKPLTGNEVLKYIQTQSQFYGQLIKEIGLEKK
jgi:tripartite-type tricarboxylate transporter receptor subunit TctC